MVLCAGLLNFIYSFGVLFEFNDSVDNHGQTCEEDREKIYFLISKLMYKSLLIG